MHISLFPVVFSVILASSLGTKTTSDGGNGVCEEYDFLSCGGSDDKGAKLLLKKMEEECEAEEKEKENEDSFLSCLSSIDNAIKDYRNLRLTSDDKSLKRKSNDLNETDEGEDTSAEDEDNKSENLTEGSGEEEDDEKTDKSNKSEDNSGSAFILKTNSDYNDDIECKPLKANKYGGYCSTSDGNEEIESLNEPSRVSKCGTCENEKEADSIQNEKEVDSIQNEKESNQDEDDEDENYEEGKNVTDNDREGSGDGTPQDETNVEYKPNSKTFKRVWKIEPDAEFINLYRDKRGYNIGLRFYNPWLYNKIKYAAQPDNMIRT